MKQLKFMLAAAAAIGLASASQADSKTVPTVLNEGTINFDSETVGTAATNITGFVYSGDAADDESEVVAPGYGDSGNALQVSVGNDPLLRALDWSSSAAHTVDLADGSLDIETYVQFTVTPDSDTVEAGDGDKLMIYLKEDLTAGTTNLMVKALQYRAAAYDEDQDDWVDGVSNVVDVVAVRASDANSVAVETNTWYKLNVKAKVQDNETMFEVYLDDVQLKPADALYASASNLFPSLLAGSGAATLQYVGFAGEGKVDNIKVTQDRIVNSVDFTLTLGANVTSVAYTIGDAAQVVASNATTTVQAFPEDVITIGTVTYAEGYVAAAGSPVAEGFTATVDGYTVGSTACSLTFSATLNSVDFTFALGTGVTAINWTIDGGAASTALSGSGVPGAAITINSVTYADWYVASGSVTNGAVLEAAATTFNVTATAKGTVDPDTGAVTVDSATTPADIGITSGSFASEAAGSEDLAKVVAWATASSKGNKTASDAISAINAMTFVEGSETQTEKAYLFNVADDAAAVAAAEAAFKFETIDTSSLPPAVSGADNVNGTVTIQGATTLGNWHTATEADKFFKATITK